MKEKIGDIVENSWADDANPYKRMIYLGQTRYLCIDGQITSFGKQSRDYRPRRKVLGNAFIENWRDILAARDLPGGLRGWIKCSDRMPDDGTFCLTIDEYQVIWTMSFEEDDFLP